MENNEVKIKEQNLDIAIQDFFKHKEKLEEYKKMADTENKFIKYIMNELELDKFMTSNGLQAKLTKSNKETFNEPALIEKLIESDVTKEAIKLVPQIDFNVLEDLIYNGKLDASELTPYKEVKVVETLKVTMKKGE